MDEVALERVICPNRPSNKLSDLTNHSGACMLRSMSDTLTTMSTDSPTDHKEHVVPSHIDADQAAELLIAGTRGAIVSTFAGGVSGEVDSARALRLPALALEALTDGVVIYSNDGRIAHLNDAACSILELDGAPDGAPLVAPGKRPWWFDSRDKQRRLLCLAERALQPLQHAAGPTAWPTGAPARDFRITTPAGRDVLLSGYVRPLRDAEGRMVGSVAIILTVTDDAPLTITAAPRRVMRAQSSGGMVAPAEAMDRRQRRAPATATRGDDEFVAEAMHELRNVMASLCGYVDLLSAGVGSGQQSNLAKGRIETIEEIKEIERAAGCLAELAVHIDDVLRLRAERFAIDCHAADLVALVRRVVHRLQVTTQRHTIAVSTAAASIMAQIDVRRVEQVLTNLLGNAIKYSPDGGEIMVMVCEDQERGRNIVLVRDHGIGIPSAQRRRVFQRFGRADNARALGVDGAGLGLYICREIVERHGGHIWFRSRVRRGTTFCISLPVALVACEMHDRE